MSYHDHESIEYSKLVTILVKLLNKVREDPFWLQAKLNQRALQYEGKKLRLEGKQNTQVDTCEGQKPVVELLRQFANFQKLPHLKWSYQLHCAASERARICARLGSELDLHNRPTLGQLLKQMVKYSGQVSQQIICGICDPTNIILELLIDDGNFQRTNRRRLLSPLYTHIGVGIEEHPKYKFVVVIVLAARVEPLPKFFPEIDTSTIKRQPLRQPSQPASLIPNYSMDSCKIF